MILCMCEKPSVGADIAKILGCHNRRDGYFEGSKYCVTWTFGHLCELKDPHEYNPDWKKWSIKTLPMIPEKFQVKVKNDKGILHQFKVIKDLIKKADKVINCGDAGQEGELIQRWVMQEAGCKKPVERLWISSLTEEAIVNGFRNLRPQKDYDNLYVAGMCRAVGDWVLGLNATRLYTLKYTKRTFGEQGSVLSVGRVQTPTLALVVNRQHEIANFVPTTSYELRTRYRGVVFTSVIDPFRTEQDGQPRLREVAGKLFEIIHVDRKQTKEAPPRLFDLTALQIEANKKFGMSADLTLKTIQSLYEKKLTTYPRVDTTYLTDDMYPKCGRILSSLKSYANFVAPLNNGTLPKRKSVFDDSKVTDHHAIIPTGNQPDSLSQTESQIYDLIARRFIAAFLPECVYDQTQIKGRAGDVGFHASGKRIASPGWRALYLNDSKSDSLMEDEKTESENCNLPEFANGESGSHEPFLAKKVTTPPAYYTEGSLLKAMETAGTMVEDEELREALKANGIGRPSTRAAIIEILYKRGYIAKQGKSIRATQAGIDLISIIDYDVLKSAKLTGLWERKLRDIERGSYSASSFMKEINQLIGAIVTTVSHDESQRVISTAVAVKATTTTKSAPKRATKTTKTKRKTWSK